MSLKESKEIAKVIIQELDKIFGERINLAISTTVTVCMPYKYAKRLTKNEVLISVEMSLLRLYRERESVGIKRVRLCLRKRDVSLIEITLMR